MDLFNVSYEILLLMLQRFFAHTEETEPQLKALADATIALMFGAIKPLGDLVTTLPAGPEYPGRTAGPSFELFYESDYVLPHREAAWILLTERVRQAAEFCEPGAPCDPPVADGLAAVRSGLNEIADALAAHLPSVARTAPTPAPAEDLGTLLARADDFYRTGLAFASHDDPALSGVAALLGSAYQAVRANQDNPRTVARLVNSVLRPLASALPGTPPPPNAPHPPPTPRPPTPKYPSHHKHPPTPKCPLRLRRPHRLSGTSRSPLPPYGRASAPTRRPPRPRCSRRSRRCRTGPSGRCPQASGPA